MTKYPMADVRQSVRDGDPWAIEDRNQLFKLMGFLEEDTQNILAGVLPITDLIDWAELGQELGKLADDAWVQVQAEVKKTRPPDYFAQWSAKACKSGCAYCCYLGVEATRLECLAIAHHFTLTLEPEALFVLIRRVRSTALQLQDLTASSRIPERVPCSLLDIDTGTCTGYDVRPLTCRGYNSMAVEPCAAGWGMPDALTPADPWQASVFGAILEGVRSSLKQNSMSTMVELNAGLLWAFETLAQTQSEHKFCT